MPSGRTGHRLELLAIAGILIFASIFPVDLSPAPHQPSGADGQYSGKQGDVLVITVPATEADSSVTGRFLTRHVPFFRSSFGYTGLLGIDMEDAPGPHELTVQVHAETGSRKLSYNVLVIKEKFPVQHLTLPKDQVDLDETSLVRVKAEQEEIRSALQEMTLRRLWNGPFIEPLSGTSTGAFGRLRIINGQSRSPHNGEDIAAPMGTEVRSIADGIARLTVDHFFSGKGLYVDHGLGLYSMYFHLSEILVRDGEPVSKGQPIGKVGTSGRASGPHLHWGVRVNGARVNPYSLLKLDVGS